MALVLQVIVTGLAAGAGYGLLAIGFALVHRLTGVVHLALGELVALSVVTTLYAVAGADLVTSSSVSTGRFVGAAAGGIAFAGLLGVLTYLAAVRPFLRRGLEFGWIASTVAIAFAVHGLVAAVLVRDSYVVPDPLPFERIGTRGVLDLGGGVTVPVRAFFVIAVGVLLAEGSARFLGRTRTGRAMRAVATQPEGAHLTGLPVDRLLGTAFALAGILAAVAAIVQAPSVPFTADTGAVLGLKGLAAALLAGFGSPRRAFAAGLAVGVVETSAASLDVGPVSLGAEYRDLIPLALALVVLSARRLGAGRIDE